MAMTDEEQAAWDEMGIGQPPSRDPARSIAKFLFLIGGALMVVFVLAGLFGR
jgi:hypothetical protein